MLAGASTYVLMAEVSPATFAGVSQCDGTNGVLLQKTQSQTVLAHSVSLPLQMK